MTCGSQFSRSAPRAPKRAEAREKTPEKISM